MLKKHGNGEMGVDRAVFHYIDVYTHIYMYMYAFVVIARRISPLVGVKRPGYLTKVLGECLLLQASPNLVLM